MLRPHVRHLRQHVVGEVEFGVHGMTPVGGLARYFDTCPLWSHSFGLGIPDIEDVIEVRNREDHANVGAYLA